MSAQEQVANEAAVALAQEPAKQEEQKPATPKSDDVEALADAVDQLDVSRGKRRPKRTESEYERIWEEEQKKKEVVETGVKGTVKWYSILGRYGFIQRADGQGDLFVHQTAISKSTTLKRYLRTLADEEEVLFDVVQGKKGPEAANVTGPEGKEVMGSRHRYLLLHKNRRFRNRKNKSDVSVENAEAEKPAGEKAPLSPEKAEKLRKRRQNRKAKKAAAKNAESDKSEEAKSADETSEQAKEADAIAEQLRIDNKLQELEQGNERCNSALGDASLGAQSIDAQI